MPRDYVPVPVEYRQTLDLLSDEDFGRLIRALIDYAVDGTPIELDGDARFYNKIIMMKDDYYAGKFAEEQEKAAKRSKHASTAINARWNKGENPEINTQKYPGIPENTISYQINSDHVISDQINSVHINSSCSELCESSEPAEPPVIKIPLNDGTEFPVYQKDIALWQETYQAVDVYQQLKEIRSWSDANPAKRKTPKGVRRFINMWLAKEQDRGGSPQDAGGRKQGPGAKKAPVLTEFE